MVMARSPSGKETDCSPPSFLLDHRNVPIGVAVTTFGKTNLRHQMPHLERGRYLSKSERKKWRLLPAQWVNILQTSCKKENRLGLSAELPGMLVKRSTGFSATATLYHPPEDAFTRRQRESTVIRAENES